jgi:diaminopimelate decarboxylase
MHNFERRGSILHCENVSLIDLAERFGTPLYVYSRATFTRHFEVFDEAFDPFDHLICFAVKANSSMALLSLLGRLGSGADIVSGGELYRALEAGIPAERIVYSGVGKTETEMAQALDAEILMFNIESLQELEALSRAAVERGRRARIALRVNPDVDPGTHPYVATGLRESKFGIDIKSAVAAYERAAGLGGVEVIGVDCHIGSQLTEIAPFTEAVERLQGLIAALEAEGHAIRYLDLGGGLGITYDAEEPPLPAEYGRAIRQVLGEDGPTLILEPGRNIAGNAGVLLTRVLYTKQTDDKRFVIADAGMNDLVRPSLYNAHHRLEPVVDEGRSRRAVDVVGPICESGDFLARGRDLPELHPGELLVAMSAGAYGFSMASTYNSRPLAAEVLVDGDRAHLIRERGAYEDLNRGERIPDLG